MRLKIAIALLLAFAASFPASFAASKKVSLPGPSAKDWPCRENFSIVQGEDSDITAFAKKYKVPPLILLAWNPVLAEEGRVRRYREKRVRGRLARQPVNILICREPFLRTPLGTYESPYKLVLSRFAGIYTYPWAELGSRWRADVPPGKRVRMAPETCLTFARKPHKMRLRLSLPAPARTEKALNDVARTFGVSQAVINALNAKALQRGYLTREDVVFLPYPRIIGVEEEEEDEPAAEGEKKEEEAGPAESIAPPGTIEPSGEETD